MKKKRRKKENFKYKIEEQKIYRNKSTHIHVRTFSKYSKSVILKLHIHIMIVIKIIQKFISAPLEVCS